MTSSTGNGYQEALARLVKEGMPEEWARRAIATARKYGADSEPVPGGYLRVIYEKNHYSVEVLNARSDAGGV